MENKICIVILWFGKLPETFPIWLSSAEANNTIDFLIFTDQKINLTFAENIKIHNISFENMRKNIQKKYNFTINLNSAYKLCDYKPAYGDIFEVHLKKYDFWGFCDIDLIFGDIRHFLTDDILNEYKKILSRGHLTIFKNQKNINCLYKRNDYYRKVFSSPKSFAFDEWGEMGINDIFNQENHQIYDEIVFEDIDISKYAFYSSQLQSKENRIYFYEKGKLYKYTNEGKKEILYAHHQKRKLKVTDYDNEKLNYIAMIPPNTYQIFNSKEEFYNEKQSFLNINRAIYTPYLKYRFQNLLKKIKRTI